MMLLKELTSPRITALASLGLLGPRVIFGSMLGPVMMSERLRILSFRLV